MTQYSTNTYTMKREIINFSNKLSEGLSRPERKFYTDMTYGMLASCSCLLTDIAQVLQEDILKINVVDRLSRHLGEGIPSRAMWNYLKTIRRWASTEPVIYIDDSDVIKPDGYHFEALGVVRDGSKSTKEKSIYCKGYHVTEACFLTTSGHPVSLFSQLHSSAEKSFTSVNDITFAAMERGMRLFGKATYVMDRGYDDNKIFNKLTGLGQDYVIRLTKKRKLFYNGKWIPATELCAKRKGKVKMTLRYKGQDHEAYLSHVKVQVTASKENVYLVLVYGITEFPMMLLTNKPVRSTDDVRKIAKLYFSRWRIEEYFRSKKQIFAFENFRVRKLKAINALNFYIGVCMAFLGHMTRKKPTNGLLCAIIEAAAPLKAKVHFHYYRIAAGIAGILHHAKEGVKRWFKALRPDQCQLRLRLPA